MDVYVYMYTHTHAHMFCCCIYSPFHFLFAFFPLLQLGCTHCFSPQSCYKDKISNFTYIALRSLEKNSIYQRSATSSSGAACGSFIALLRLPVTQNMHHNHQCETLANTRFIVLFDPW